MSLKSDLLSLIKYNGIARFDDLEAFTKSRHYKASNGERRLRELRQAGLIEEIMSAGAVVGYKIPDKPKEQGKLMEIKPKLKSTYEKNYQ